MCVSWYFLEQLAILIWVCMSCVIVINIFSDVRFDSHFFMKRTFMKVLWWPDEHIKIFIFVFVGAKTPIQMTNKSK